MNESVLMSYLKGEMGEEECFRVEAWVAASAANKKLLEDLYYVHFLGERQAVMAAIDVEQSLVEWKRKMQPVAGKPKRLFAWRRYAAHIAAFVVGALFAGGALGLYWGESASTYCVATEAGQRAQVVLPDGTKLWVNAASSVKYTTSLFSSARRVALEGEAYFEVTKRAGAPFTVSSHGIETRVTGTKFNIRAYKQENRVKTTLLEGGIEVTVPTTAAKAIGMRANEELTVNLATLESNLTHTDTAGESIRWIGGALSFHQATLKEIAEALESHYDVRIKIEGSTLAQQRFSCDFDLADDIYQILSVLSYTKSFNFHSDGKEITLTAR